MIRSMSGTSILATVALCLTSAFAHALGDVNDLHGVEKLASMNENTRNALDKAQRKLEHALTSLQFLRETDDKNAKNAYGKFKDESQEFRNQVKDVQDKITRVENDTNAFFSSWTDSESLMTSDRARARSERRRVAAENAFRGHLAAFQEVRNVFDPAVTIFMELVEQLADNYGARNDASVAESQTSVQRIADDVYWQIDNAIAKTELFE